MSPDPRSRPWIDAMDAFARRQRCFMLLAVAAWIALALGQALGTAWLWSGAWTVIATSPRVVLPITDTTSRCCCVRLPIDGLRSMLWTWAAVALLPIVLVPPRRVSPSIDPPERAAPSNPYRMPATVTNALPDLTLRSRLRHTRRVLVAAAGASWMLLHADWQAIILGKPFHAEVNGVALLDALVALIVVLGYSLVALRRDRSPRASRSLEDHAMNPTRTSTGRSGTER